MSNSVRPHRRQPTRFRRPWDSPGKDTGWVAISFSKAWKWKVKGKSLSCVRLFATPWTAAYQAPPSMGFSRQEYWSGVPLPSPTFCLEVCNLWPISLQSSPAHPSALTITVRVSISMNFGLFVFEIPAISNTTQCLFSTSELFHLASCPLGPFIL